MRILTSSAFSAACSAILLSRSALSSTARSTWVFFAFCAAGGAASGAALAAWLAAAAVGPAADASTASGSGVNCWTTPIAVIAMLPKT